MRRLMACGFIATYLMLLVFGLFSHTLGYKASDHVGMYFIVWDMYCGWCGYETRHHIIAAGESGQHYDLTPPWGEFEPFGAVSRHHYDGSATYSGALAKHVLDHTEHEPIVDIVVVEESWSRKYNLPDSLYEARYEIPKVKRSYFRPLLLMTSDGIAQERYLNWTSWLAHQALVDNPRLQKDMLQRPFLTTEQMISPSRVRPVNHSTSRTRP